MQSQALAHPNIALIKYWGNRDDDLRIPSNGSISLTLGGLENRISIEFDESADTDLLLINGSPARTDMLDRVSNHLDLLREEAGVQAKARVESATNFPIGAGIASSAAAFAALTVAASDALGMELERQALSRLARRGSGSAARSIHGGYVELLAGSDQSSVAEQIAPADHWEIIDLIVLVDEEPKHTGSTSGHNIAATSPLQEARVADADRRLETCRQAVIDRDYKALAHIVERDSDMMHAIMMTSQPPLHFWTSESHQVMAMVRDLRSQNVPVCYTLDAGPNVHCLCLPQGEDETMEALKTGAWKVLRAHPGGAAKVV